MTYVKTHLKKDITIDSIITIHYFEYMKDFVFNGEAHDFWEFMYVDKGSVLIRSEDDHLHLNTGDIFSISQMNFTRSRQSAINHQTLLLFPFFHIRPQWICFARKTVL